MLSKEILKGQQIKQKKLFKEWIFRPKENRYSKRNIYPLFSKVKPSYQKSYKKRSSGGDHKQNFNAFSTKLYYNRKMYCSDYEKYWNKRTRSFKTARCWYFDQTGGCKYGDSCHYRHFKMGMDIHLERYGSRIPKYRDTTY